jgi:hypothetical protein
MATESALSSQASGDAPQSDLEADLDSVVQQAGDFRAITDWLVGITIPDSPWDNGLRIGNPLAGDLGNRLWPWNRAASRLITLGRKNEAVEVWSALYLSFLTLQSSYRHRYHKGMALCNIGYALGKVPGQRIVQAKSWLLGIIEDTLTDFDSAPGQLNLRNTLSMRGVTRPVLLQLVNAVRSRFVDQSIVPLLPELCVELWLDPTRRSNSEKCVKAIAGLLASLQNSYPRLPAADSYFRLVAEAWDFADWSRGIISNE